MKHQILGERLRTLIGSSKVKSALFYTFNFEPEFFENYVMPILLSSKDFTDNKIQNTILWRRLKSEDKIPPITIYYDEKVKRIDQAPQLDYKTIGMKLKGANFHPKNSFILTDDNRLIVLIGSNNMSGAGWNTNLEAVNDFVLNPDSFFPQDLKNEIRSFIEQVALKTTKSENSNSISENLILDFLNKRKYSGETFPFYFSYDKKTDFESFIKTHIPEKENIHTIEIISPFYSSDTHLLSKLKNIFTKTELKILCLAPNNKEDYLEIDKEVYQKYKDAGVIWSKWENSQNINQRVHAKVYRFHGKNQIYNIIGSVNFTEQAWNTTNKGNVESALLLTEKNNNATFIKESFDKYKFVGEQENQEKADELFSLVYPDIHFVLDWKLKKLFWNNKSENELKLNLPNDEIIKISAKEEKHIELSTKLLGKYADNAIVKITKNQDVFYYYPDHLNIEYKPLNSRFRFTDVDVLNVWNLLNISKKDNSQNIIDKLGQIIEKLSNEEGEIDYDKIAESESILNKMALNLSALVNLERFLFSGEINFSNIKHYLTTENPDSIPFYIKELKKKQDGDNETQKMLPGFYWLLLSIIIKNFFKNKNLVVVDTKTNEDISLKIYEITAEIANEISKLEKIDGLNKIDGILNWAKKNI